MTPHSPSSSQRPSPQDPSPPPGDASGSTQAAVDAFGSFVEKRYEAEPEARLAAVMLQSARTSRHLALATLEHEWMELAFGPSDGAIGLAKIAWWRDEVERYAAGRPQHPVTRVLAASPDPVSADDLRLAIECAAPLAELASPADAGELLEPFRHFALAVLPWWGASDRDTGAVDAYAAALALQQLRQWPRFARPSRALVPLAALAASGVNRVDLVSHANHEVAAGVVSRLARELGAKLDAADPSHRSARLTARVASARALAVALQRSPERALAGHARASGLPLLWRLWRIARRERSVG